MKQHWKQSVSLTALLAALSQAACSAHPSPQHSSAQEPSSRRTQPTVEPAVTAPNSDAAHQTRANVAEVRFAYPHSRCSYPYSPTDFCDAVHMRAYNEALQSKSANFSKDLILLDIPTRAAYHQRSLVVIEPETGAVWPFPFDAYSGPVDGNGEPTGEGTLDFSVDSDTVCVGGALLVYRVLENGRFCFTFDGGRFEGHVTQYTSDPDV